MAEIGDSEDLGFAQVLRQEYLWLETRVADESLTEEALRKDAHEDENGLSAVCLSGGGIRSAAFSLGVLAELRRQKVLHQFHYLSTVSGGGFAGGWLSSATRNASNAELPAALERALDEDGVRQFRENGRYLAPRVALLSADLWSLLLEYLRPFLLNLLAIAPILVAALSIPRVLYAALLAWWGQPSWLLRVLAVLGPPCVVLAVAIVVWIFAGVRGWRPIQGWFARLLAVLVMFSLAAAVSIAGPPLLDQFLAPAAAGTGGVSAVLLAAVRYGTQRGDEAKLGKVGGFLLPAVAACFVLSVCLGVASVLHSAVGYDLVVNVLVLLASVLAMVLLSLAYQPNATSLHHVYAKRLRVSFVEPMTPKSDDRNKPLHLHEIKRKRLFPIINVAVNVTSSKHTTGGMADRRAYSGTLSPLHVGYDHPEKQRRCYGKATFATDSDGPMTLSRAMALSGAAVNSGMGFYTSTWYAFALTLLNMRLGLWQTLPPKQQPEFAWAGLRLRTQELLGLHDIRGGTVNVSDGGHFDNLGLYQMLRRRCRWILVVDGGGDDPTELGDFARAIRLARIDLDIQVTMHGLDLDSKGNGPRPGVYKGHINYRDKDGPAAKDGVLVYIRPEVTDRSPVDVRSYANRHPKFPEESTGDQFFSEDQFESYRALGSAIVRQAVALYELEKTSIMQLGSLAEVPGFVSALAESAVLVQERDAFPTHAGIILQDDDKYLVVGSSDNREWVLPKGHIEAGEDPRSTALREFAEETRQKIVPKGDEQPLRPAFIDEPFTRNGKTFRVAYYLVNKKDVELHPLPGPERRPRGWIYASASSTERPRTSLEAFDPHTVARGDATVEVYEDDRNLPHPVKVPEFVENIVSRATEIR